MNSIWNEIKVFSKNMKYGLGIIKKIAPYYLFINCFSSIMNVLVGYYNSVIFMKMLLDSFSKNYTFEEMYPLFFWAVVINLLSCMINALKSNYYENKIQLKLNQELKHMIYNKATNLAFRQYYELNIKNVMNFSVNNITAVMLGLITTISTIFGVIFQTILNISTLVIMGGKEVFILVPLLIAVCIYRQYIQVKLNKEDFQLQQDTNEINRRKYYYSGGIFMNKSQNQVVRVYDCFDMLKKKFIKTFDDETMVNLKHHRKSARWSMQLQIISGLFLNVTTLLVLGYRAVYLKNLSAGDYWAIYYVYNSLSDGNIFNIYSQVQNNSQWLQYLHNFFDTEEEKSGTLPVQLESEDWTIEFDHVSFAYPTDDKEVLRDVSFTLHRGELVSFVGDNGAGKSTIILLLLRLFDPLLGCVRLNGIDIREYDIKEYRKCFANLYQQYKIIPLTVAQNISLSYDTSQVEGKVEKCLQNALIDQKINQLDKKMHTSMTKDYDVEGYVPSGGELRKIGLAHNFYSEAPIMILDEFDAEMDPISEEELNQTIIKNRRELGIVVTHRLSICSSCDKILYFSKGKLIEQGSHFELVNSGGEYAKTYRMKQKLYGLR